jgi:hypothetical protein
MKNWENFCEWKIMQTIGCFACDDELKVCSVVLAQVESTNIRHHRSKMGKN